MYHFICALCDGKVSIKALTSPARTVILYPNYSKVYLTLTVRSLVGKGYNSGGSVNQSQGAER